MPEDAQLSTCRVAIMADFTPDFLVRELKNLASSKSIRLETMQVGPATWEAEVLNTDSALYNFKPGIVLVCLSAPMQWLKNGLRSGSEPLHKILYAQCEHLWQVLHSRLPDVEILQTNLGPFEDGLPLEVPHPQGEAFCFQQSAFNHRLKAALPDYHYLSLINWEACISRCGTAQSYDSRLWLTAAHPFSLDFLKELSVPVIEHLKSRSGKFLKVIVLDLDETLWGGIVGDDGPESIEIGQEGLGNIFLSFQLWIKRLKDCGLLLAVASRNEDEVARSAFTNEKNLLSLEDFAAFRAGWIPKSEMMRDISRQLNIGLEAFCFIDNSAFERNEVRGALPSVCVPELPDDPAEWIPFLSNQSLFQETPASENGDLRTQWIRTEEVRQENQKGFTSYEDYLVSLGMKGRFEPMKAKDIRRAHELIMRSNQFNLRTIRHPLSKLEDILESDLWSGYMISLSDGYGDYGQVGLVLLKKDSPEATSVFINTWIMSCRVFERGVEYWAFNQLITALKSSGVEFLEAEFIPSTKNGKFSGILQELGFSNSGSGGWRLDLNAAPLHETHIESN